MLTNNQVIEKIVNSQVRKRVKSAIQVETLQNIVVQEINSAIATAFNSRLEAERDRLRQALTLFPEQPVRRVSRRRPRDEHAPETVAPLFDRALEKILFLKFLVLVVTALYKA